jgi:hypothetical protein
LSFAKVGFRRSAVKFDFLTRQSRGMAHCAVAYAVIDVKKVFYEIFLFFPRKFLTFFNVFFIFAKVFYYKKRWQKN